MRSSTPLSAANRLFQHAVYEQPAKAPGLSVFFRLDEAVFHTYSAYARGVEGLTNTSILLDVTPYGRQEAWEDSPGWLAATIDIGSIRTHEEIGASVEVTTRRPEAISTVCFSLSIRFAHDDEAILNHARRS